MIFRSLDENHDWNFGKGKNDYLSENEAIGLNVKTRILSWYKDCFFALFDGIDWYNRLGSKNQRVALENDLRNVILQSEGVTGIVEFSTELIGRNFSASYTINTIYGKGFQNSINVGA